MIHTVAVSGYRSLRDLVVPLDALTVVTGENGSGKSSLYRCLRLLAATAEGRLIRSLAEEGGFQSTLWAGPESIAASVERGEYRVEPTRRTHPVRLRLGFASDDLAYSMELGRPSATQTGFASDPIIRLERIVAGRASGSPGILAARDNGRVLSGRLGGALTSNLGPFDSMLTLVGDAYRAPEILTVRERLRGWRFYDRLRCDRDAPARRPQVGTWTPTLSHDGGTLAATIRTIQETMIAPEALHEAVDDAFPGSRLSVCDLEGGVEVQLQQHGMLRPLRAAELSEGTLRYLMLLAALISDRLGPLVVLNEPEQSLHVDLLAPLARLLVRASEYTQVWVVTHSKELARRLEEADALHLKLYKRFGETRVEDAETTGLGWSWPKRNR